MSSDDRVARRVIATLNLLCLALFPAPGWNSATEEKTPVDTGFREEVKVRITQIEVTAWPRHDDVASCLDLGRDDFELTVNGLPRDIVAVDRLGDLGRAAGEPAAALAASPAADRPEERTAPTDGSPHPAQFVFYFDLWHLNKFVRSCSALSQPLAFSWVRHMIEDTYRPGDRVMLASFSGRPKVQTGWLADRQAILDALDDLEASPALRMPNRSHLHHDRWVRGWTTLFQALGVTPGRKHLFYLGDDIDWRPDRRQLYALAGRAQASHVLVHAVDLIWNCRARPPLLSSQYHMPLALGTLPYHTGGRLFATGLTVARAVNQLRDLQACSYRLSFRSRPEDSQRRAPALRVGLKRKGFRLAAPVSFEQDGDSLPAGQMARALMLLPRWERGLRIDAALWPLHPAKKKRWWRALLMARIRRPADATPAGSLSPLVVEARVSHGAKIYGRFEQMLRGEALREIARTPEGFMMIVPIDVRRGEVEIVVAASDTEHARGASARSTYTVPSRPGIGKARPWILLNRLAETPGGETFRPAFENVFSPAHPPLVIGFACPPFAGGAEVPPAHLWRDGRREGRPVELEWHDPGGGVAASDNVCGWLVGSVPSNLSEGLWIFEPPASLRDDTPEGAALSFQIRAAPGIAATPGAIVSP